MTPNLHGRTEADIRHVVYRADADQWEVRFKDDAFIRFNPLQLECDTGLRTWIREMEYVERHKLPRIDAKAPEKPQERVQARVSVIGKRGFGGWPQRTPLRLAA